MKSTLSSKYMYKQETDKENHKVGGPILKVLGRSQQPPLAPWRKEVLEQSLGMLQKLWMASAYLEDSDWAREWHGKKPQRGQTWKHRAGRLYWRGRMPP